MDFPDTTGALLETFLQHFGSGLWCAQPPEFVQVVGPLHVAGKLLLGPFSCLPKLIIHELTSCFWMLWFAGWWWEDLVSNNLDSEFIFCFICVRHRNLVVFPFSRSRQWGWAIPWGWNVMWGQVFLLHADVECNGWDQIIQSWALQAGLCCSG